MNNIRSTITQYTSGRASTIHFRKGKFVLEIWDWRTTKRYGKQKEKILILTEGCQNVYFRNCDYYSYGMCNGLRVFHEHHRNHDNVLYNCDRKVFSKYYLTTELFDVQDIIDLDPSLKYCAYHQNCYINVIFYIELYRKYPIAEMLMKLNLERMITEKALTYMVNNTAFCKYLTKHYKELQDESFSVAKQCFTKGVSNPKEFIRQMENKRYISKVALSGIDKRFHKYINRQKLYDYYEEQEIFYNHRSYNDYLIACEYLKLNFEDTKVLYPNEFWKMHDLYTTEYKVQKDKDFMDNFKHTSDKFSAYNWQEQFLIRIARTPSELVEEGTILNHCVGRMGYDKKQADEKSAIFFIRKLDQPEKPYVTLEFDLKDNKILQCYGEHDTENKEANMFAKRWLKYIKKVEI